MLLAIGACSYENRRVLYAIHVLTPEVLEVFVDHVMTLENLF